ncbi:conserved hypothetical protein [Frankia canadensis]|uniref:PH domain-containing protein n=1 Tax=Frankia canadensis TaxID=1836972 RepID=A0A2I2KRB1_9ACTN|nr:hypothetical protein [Frankia canadensis]SNQ48204.1 conserved hypothetical protein [Frankia canadensis]SOU55494.1 conserved hypothetical protein [Frankia canadensis]
MTVSLSASAAVPLAAGGGSSRLGLHALLVIGLLLLLVAVVGVMRRAWRSRAERQEEDLPELPEPPAEPGTVLAAPLRGMYLGTVDAGHWLEWIAARGLGGRDGGYVSVYETGVRIDRGNDAFWIPREAVRGARLERAHAGKVSAPGRLIVIAWSYVGHELETGFRGEDRARQPKVVRAVHDLIGPPPAHLAKGDITSPHAVPRIRPPRLRPPRPGSGQPTQEMPAIRSAPRLRRGERRAEPRRADDRRQDERYPGERRHGGARPADPRYPDPDPGRSPVDPLTSPLGEVRRLKEDR